MIVTLSSIKSKMIKFHCLPPYSLSIYAITIKLAIVNKSHKIDILKKVNKRNAAIHKQTEYNVHNTKNTML